MKPLAPERVVLLKAADLIEWDGWCQGDYDNSDGSHCVAGAIFETSQPAAAFLAQKLLAAYLDIPWTRLPLWNDASSRTQAEVTSALRAAAVHGL